MNVHDPATWPQQPGLSYQRITRGHGIAHAFVNNWALCSFLNLAPGEGAIPTKVYIRLCSNCIKGLRSLGYVSRSEKVDW